jgi:hypothetical protein
MPEPRLSDAPPTAGSSPLAGLRGDVSLGGALRQIVRGRGHGAFVAAGARLGRGGDTGLAFLGLTDHA